MTETTTDTKWVIEATTSSGAGLIEGILEKLTENAPEEMHEPVFLGALDGSIGAIFEVEASSVGNAISQGERLFFDLLSSQGVTLAEIDYLAAHRFEEIDILDESEDDPFDDDEDGDEDAV